MRSYLIACTYFEGAHDARNTFEKLSTIYSKFGILHKITATTTDNGSEFVASFKHYGMYNRSYDGYVNDPTEVDVSHENDSDDIMPILPDDSNIDGDPYAALVAKDELLLHPLPTDILPNRVECSAHGLNLVGKTDSYKALQNQPYAALYCAVFRKLNSLWHHACCRKSCEAIVKYLGRTITRPDRIRWNYIYDSVCFYIEFVYDTCNDNV